MKKTENKQAREWINSIIWEMKSYYSELLYPLSVLKLEEAPEGECTKGIGTDGVTLYYDPYVIMRQSRKQIMQQILHIMIHGMLGHFHIKDQYTQRLPRDYMMDIQVSYLQERIGTIAGNRLHILEVSDEWIKGDYSMNSYHFLCEKKKSDSSLDHYYSLLLVDDHMMWDCDMSNEHKQKVIKIWGEIREIVLGEEDVTIASGEEGVNADGQMFEKVVGIFAGKGSGNAQNQYRIGKGSRKNYKELLTELFQMQEINREEPDTVDPMFYGYGLELYGDVPLIEPLEVTEQAALHTLAIAVDVSGSCAQGDIMEKFWGETYECISQVKECCAQGEILLLQCDDVIQSLQRIRLDEFNEKPEYIRANGFGGTSFIPVFEKLKELEEKEQKIDALIYLTDGMGDYPEKKPDYPVYFVLSETNFSDDYLDEEIPDWIHKICIE